MPPKSFGFSPVASARRMSIARAAGESEPLAVTQVSDDFFRYFVVLVTAFRPTPDSASAMVPIVAPA